MPICMDTPIYRDTDITRISQDAHRDIRIPLDRDPYEDTPVSTDRMSLMFTVVHMTAST